MDALQRTIHNIDPTIAVVTSPLNLQLREYFARPRFQTTLLALFSLMGLCLAAVGLYGLTSYMVAERTREMGVRIALGATPGKIVRMLMAQGMRWTLAGALVGLAASVGLMRFLRSLLFEAETLEWWAPGWAVMLLVLVATLAVFLPGRRAARTDPMTALRQE